MNQFTIGVDISKEHLDVNRLPDGAARQFANTKVGLTKLIRWIGAMSIKRIVFASSNHVIGFHEAGTKLDADSVVLAVSHKGRTPEILNALRIA